MQGWIEQAILARYGVKYTWQIMSSTRYGGRRGLILAQQRLRRQRRKATEVPVGWTLKQWQSGGKVFGHLEGALVMAINLTDQDTFPISDQRELIEFGRDVADWGEDWMLALIAENALGKLETMAYYSGNEWRELL